MTFISQPFDSIKINNGVNYNAVLTWINTIILWQKKDRRAYGQGTRKPQLRVDCVVCVCAREREVFVSLKLNHSPEFVTCLI